MPFKSEAQRRKFYAMADRGEMSRSKVEEYERATKGDIPERVRGGKNTERQGNISTKRELKRRAKRKAAEKLRQSKSEAEQAS